MMTAVENPHTVVKICGLRDVAAARVAALAGADYLGFILAKSRRQVSPVLTREVSDALSSAKGTVPRLVGVTVNSTGAEIEAFVGEGRLDLIQLSGEESPELLDDIDMPVIKTIHVSHDMERDDLARTIDPWFDHARPVRHILVDAKVAGHYGGSGTRADWTIASFLAERYAILLAGGLAPGNVSEGIAAVRPTGVDVSSGVEIAGVKDHVLIQTFVANARRSFAEESTGRNQSL